MTTLEQLTGINLLLNLVTLLMLFFNWRVTYSVCEYLKWWQKNFERNNK